MLLEEKLKEAERVISEQAHLIEEQSEQIKKLKQEILELKERLGLNSRNSSMPSARDLYRLEKKKACSGRKRGGQPGHKKVERVREEAQMK